MNQGNPDRKDESYGEGYGDYFHEYESSMDSDILF